jgi:2-methylcitrate dehydratase PrpD
MTKSLHAGLAARDGVMAALLAQKGFTASRTGLEGENGLKTLIITGSPPGEEEIIKLCENYDWWDILSGNGIVFKRSPACALSHPGLDAVLELAVREDIDADNVESIVIDTMDYAFIGLMHHDPKTGLEGKFSLEYCAAIAVLDKAAGIQQFTTEKVDRARPLTHKVRITTHKALPGRTSTRYNEAEAVVTLKDGRVLRNKVTFPLGHPDCERPFTWEHLRTKYVECVSLELPEEKVRRSEELLRNLEQAESFREIVASLTAEAAGRP